MNRKLLDFIRHSHMLSPGDSVICAVSGGRDSMALLHLMLELQDTLSVTVSAAHFNHQLRGEESLRDAEFVWQHCKRLGIPVFMGQGDVAAYAKTHGLGTEAAARTLRYEFLESLSPGAKIATAHNAQDNLETMLMHLLRGCSLHGLSGIPPVRGRIIRPLLTCPPEELSDYLTQNHIPHVEDSTNALDDCQRNRLRHHVIPLLLAENPGLSAAASELCLQLGQEDQYLNACAQKHYELLLQNGALNCAGLLKLPNPMAYRVLKEFLAPVPEVAEVHLSGALELANSRYPSATLHLPGGYILARDYDKLTLQNVQDIAAPSLPGPVELSPGETIQWGSCQISCRLGTMPEHPKSALYLAPEALHFPLTVRSRQPGDRIRLPGGSKKLSHWMVDQKIPAALRNQLPVLAQNQEVLAVLPYVAAAPHRAKPGSPSLILTVKRTEEKS